MMLDVVGNIKVAEDNPERIKYLIACIRSFEFLKDHCRFVLNMEGASEPLMAALEVELEEFDHTLINDTALVYAELYSNLLAASHSPFFLTFFTYPFLIFHSL